MFTIKLEAAKKGFFDREEVLRAIDKKARKVLSRFGAFVRRTAQKSIRTSDEISEPGKPPASHTGLLRKFIFFSYDFQRKSVVIGPTLLRNNSKVPRLLEYGGTAPLEKRQLDFARSRRWKRKTSESQFAIYRARPYMRPAFERELAFLPEIWKKSVR